jgi:hypothetical protein
VRNVLVIVGGVLAFFACVTGAGALSTPINQDRRDKNLAASDDLVDLPPEMAVLQAALGTFRGVAVNFVWMRAEDLKNDGKYAEAVDLGKVITRLQPRYPKVWEFVSWNQAYNISVGTHTPEERWFWVRSGIDVLQNRGGGVDANPNAVPLYQQLAWIYHHKVGMFQDQYNWHYKKELAQEWNAILGEPPREMEAYRQWLSRATEAAAREADLPAGARQALAAIREDGLEDPVEILQAYTVPASITPLEESTQAETDEGEPQYAALPARTLPEGLEVSDQDLQAMDAYLRRAAIESDRLNMDPAAMLRDAEEFGPIDWRHPAAHAIYWSRRALERLDANEARDATGRTNVRRQILNSLDQLADQGRVVYDPVLDYISYLPDWPFWLSFDEFYQEMLTVDPEGTERRYGSGYRNRMDEAVADAELFGERDVALALLDRLRQRYDGEAFADRYEKTLDEFLEIQFRETIENPDRARAAIAALISQGLASRHLQQDDERAAAMLARSVQLYDGWRELNPDPNDPQYQEVPPFGEFYADAVARFLLGFAGAQGAAFVPWQARANAWRMESSQIIAYVFGRHGPQLYAATEAQGIDPEAIFPPPAGFSPRESEDATPTADEARQEVK